MADERITVNTDQTITPGLSSDAALRNSLGRVFLENGEPFQVIVKTATDETVTAKGTATAKPGKLCSLYVKVRAEMDVDAPVVTPVELEI